MVRTIPKGDVWEVLHISLNTTDLIIGYVIYDEEMKSRIALNPLPL